MWDNNEQLPLWLQNAPHLIPKIHRHFWRNMFQQMAGEQLVYTVIGKRPWKLFKVPYKVNILHGATVDSKESRLLMVTCPKVKIHPVANTAPWRRGSPGQHLTGRTNTMVIFHTPSIHGIGTLPCILCMRMSGWRFHPDKQNVDDRHAPVDRACVQVGNTDPLGPPRAP